jgi:hypothetical protein
MKFVEELLATVKSMALNMAKHLSALIGEGSLKREN